jgi:hypothetical protein
MPLSLFTGIGLLIIIPKLETAQMAISSTKLIICGMLAHSNNFE